MLRVEVHDASNTTWLRGEGRFVGAFAEDTKAMVVRCKLPSHLVVDLSEVTFVDAEGEEVLLWLACIGRSLSTPSREPVLTPPSARLIGKAPGTTATMRHCPSL